MNVAPWQCSHRDRAGAAAEAARRNVIEPHRPWTNVLDYHTAQTQDVVAGGAGQRFGASFTGVMVLALHCSLIARPGLVWSEQSGTASASLLWGRASLRFDRQVWLGRALGRRGKWRSPLGPGFTAV